MPHLAVLVAGDHLLIRQQSQGYIVERRQSAAHQQLSDFHRSFFPGQTPMSSFYPFQLASKTERYLSSLIAILKAPILTNPKECPLP